MCLFYEKKYLFFLCTKVASTKVQRRTPEVKSWQIFVVNFVNWIFFHELWVKFFTKQEFITYFHFFTVFQNSEIEGDLDDTKPPPKMSIDLFATDKLEMTVTKACMEMLTKLGEVTDFAISINQSQTFFDNYIFFHFSNTSLAKAVRRYQVIYRIKIQFVLQCLLLSTFISRNHCISL